MNGSSTERKAILQVTKKDTFCLHCMLESMRSLLIAMMFGTVLKIIANLAIVVPVIGWAIALLDLTWLIVLIAWPIVFYFRSREHFVKKREMCSDVFFEIVSRARDSVPESVQKFVSKKGYKVVAVKRISNVLPGDMILPADYPEQDNYSALGMCFKYFGKIIVAESVPFNDGWHSTHETVTKTLAHEVGHAVDFCLGDFSNTAKFKHAHNADYKNLSDDDKQKWKYYVRTGDQRGRCETFAEIYSCIIGEKDGFEKLFPETAKAIREELEARGLK